MSLVRYRLREALSYYMELDRHFKAVIDRSPTGTLTWQEQRGKDQFLHMYELDGKRVRRGITRDIDMQRALCQKEYALRARNLLKHDIRVIEKALNQWIPLDPDRVIQSMTKAYTKVPDSFFFDHESHVDIMQLPVDERRRIERHRKWGQQPYEMSRYKPEYKKHRTSRGLLVRSKSEALILERLDYYTVDTHYEEVHVFGDEIIVPDFTFEGADGKPFYLEHLGMMDDPDYALRNYNKLNKYFRLGLVLGKNLIITSDRSGTIDMQMIDFIIQHEIIPRL